MYKFDLKCVLVMRVMNPIVLTFDRFRISIKEMLVKREVLLYILY